MNMVWAVVRAILHGSFVTFTQLIWLPTYFFLTLVIRPLAWHSATAPLYWRIEAVYHSMMNYMFAGWALFPGHQIVETGDDLRDVCRGSAILMSNHQSAMDIPIICCMVADHKKGFISQFYCWIMHKMFLYSHFGLVGQVRGDFFIDTGKEVRDLQPKLLTEYCRDVFFPRGRQWLVIFPEGGFLFKRLKESQEYAKKYGYPVLDHTTLPRLGAMKALVDSFPKENSWIIDTTIAYPQGKYIDLHHMVFAWHKPCTTVVHNRKYKLSEIPSDEEGLLKWLYDRYAEKDKILKDYYATGELPKSNNGHHPHYYSTSVLISSLFVVFFIITLHYLLALFSFVFYLFF